MPRWPQDNAGYRGGVVSGGCWVQLADGRGKGPQDRKALGGEQSQQGCPGKQHRVWGSVGGQVARILSYLLSCIRGSALGDHRAQHPVPRHTPGRQYLTQKRGLSLTSLTNCPQMATPHPIYTLSVFAPPLPVPRPTVLTGWTHPLLLWELGVWSLMLQMSPTQGM